MTTKPSRRSYSTLLVMMIILSSAVILSTIVFTQLLMHYKRNHVVERADARLVTAAEMLHEVLGPDYHDRIHDEASISEAKFLSIVERNNKLCRRLGLQYLWSVLVVGDSIVFTSAATDTNEPESGHAWFFDRHGDPEAFDPALQARIKQPVFSTFRNEWGKGRMVLIPQKDMHGRIYIIGASIQLTELKSELNRTILTSAGIGGVVFLGVLLLSLLLVKRFTRPVARLTDAAQRIAAGDLDVPMDIRGTTEVRSLGTSFDQMRRSLKQQFTRLEQGKDREETENVILTRISKREPIERILTDIALFCEQLDPKIKASILLFKEEKQSLFHAAGPSLPDDYNDLMRPGLPIGPEVGSCGSAAFLQKLIVVDDIANSHRWIPYDAFIQKTAEHNLKACWSQPFFSSSGKLLGTIANYSNQTGSPTDDNLKALEWATRIAGLAVEQDQAEKELISAKLLAEESNKLKTAFLQNMSHEIRTPLNGIMGFCSLLKDHKNITDEKQFDEYIQMILNSSRRLLAIVNDVLEISRIESGVLKTNMSMFSLNEILAYLNDIFNAKISAKGLKYDVRVFDGLAREKLYTDKDKLLQILSNFMNNAVKFTETGSIELFIRREEEGLTVNVRDSGIGIAPEYHEKIFERFWQHEAFTQEFYGGTGLGLSISKGLADILGFEIRVQSEEGKGSLFSLFIPEGAISGGAETVKPDATPEPLLSKSLKGLSFLIVEDDNTSYLFIKDILKKAGADFDWATDGRQAVEKVDKNQYDCIIMDIKMPVMDGLEATRLIRQKHPDLLILAQTAYASAEDGESALDAGCSAFIAKPFEKEDLIRALTKLINR